MSFSPIIRVRKFLDKMKAERDSPRGIKRFPSRTLSDSDNVSAPQRPRISTFGGFSLANNEDSMDMTPLVEQFRKFSEHFDLQQGQNLFDVLPVETALYIFSFLEVRDLSRVRQVSKLWCSLADDESIWKFRCLTDFNVDTTYGNSWKETYFYIDDLFSEGLWEGMSKWVEPVGFDNEQKTTARLHFLKRRKSKLASELPKSSSPLSIRRVDSSVNATEKKAHAYRDAEFAIVGSGVTINCSSPSPFQIEGERITTSEGCKFKWNKHFEKHTSEYEGTFDLAKGTVYGTIKYHDGITEWKGVFYYTKVKRIPYAKYQQKMQVNA